jgi:hypothetical protein
MFPGPRPGVPIQTGAALQPSPDGRTVYDPVIHVTWLADANLAANITFGLPRCTDASDTSACVAPDGAMTWMSVTKFIAGMNRGGGHLGQTTWTVPPSDATCKAGYTCGGNSNPLGELYYSQLHLSAGQIVGGPSSSHVGPFDNVQPYLYWSCQANSVRDPCEATGPKENFEWSFSFGSGFQGTDLDVNDLYVAVYFVGKGC